MANSRAWPRSPTSAAARERPWPPRRASSTAPRTRSRRPTRARVLAAAADLGYAPSALAQALVQRSSRIIGVIVNDIVDPYFAEIARGVEDVAGRMGYLVMVCNADRRPEAELEYVRALREYHAVGLVFAGSGTPESAENAALDAEVGAAGARVVALAQREFPAHLVHVDNAGAAYDVTDYLISLGHRRIAFVAGPEGLATSLQRERGFLAAMEAAGLPADLRIARRVRLRGRARGRAGAARHPPAARRGRRRQRRGRDRRAHRAAPRRGRRAGRGLRRGDRRHAAGPLRRAHHGEPAALRPRARSPRATSWPAPARRPARSCSRTGWSRGARRRAGPRAEAQAAAANASRAAATSSAPGRAQASRLMTSTSIGPS